MSSLTNRGKVFVVLAFFASAALFGGAAVALVKASDHKRTAAQLPTGAPTVIYSTQTPAPTPTVTASATPSAKPTVSAAPRPSASASASPTARPTARVTKSAPPVVPSGLQGDATMNPATGPLSSSGDFKTTLLAHATDTVGTIQPISVTWGDGSSGTKAGVVCAHSVGGDCRNFTVGHTYTRAGRFDVYIRFSNGGQSTLLHIVVNISPAPSSP